MNQIETAKDLSQRIEASHVESAHPTQLMEVASQNLRIYSLSAKAMAMAGIDGITLFYNPENVTQHLDPLGRLEKETVTLQARNDTGATLEPYKTIAQQSVIFAYQLDRLRISEDEKKELTDWHIAYQTANALKSRILQ